MVGWFGSGIKAKRGFAWAKSALCFSYQDSVYRSKLYSQPDYSNKDTYVPYSLEITPPLNISLPLLFAKIYCGGIFISSLCPPDHLLLDKIF